MKKLIANILLSICSLLFLLVALEVSARLYKKEFRFINFLAYHQTLLSGRNPTEFHRELGWFPRRGSYGEPKTHTTILQDGIRSNSTNKRLNTPENAEVILAVGDSFTYGAGVNDRETWPAILERLSGKQVINGGVVAYGVDQSFIRMKILTDKYKPDIVILSLIPDDIDRCSGKAWGGVPKPYFEVVNNSLVLHNEHLLTFTPTSRVPDVYRQLLGYSFFLHKLMMKRLPGYWIKGVDAGVGEWKYEAKTAKITCQIFKDMKDYLSKKGVKQIYVLFQYTNWEYSPSAKKIPG